MNIELDHVLDTAKDIAESARLSIANPELIEALALSNYSSEQATRILLGIGLRFRLLSAESPESRRAFIAELTDFNLDRLCDSMSSKEYAEIFRECLKKSRDWFAEP